MTMQTVKFGSSRWDEELVPAVFAPHPNLPSQSSAPSADVEQERQHRKAFNLSVPAWKTASQRYKPADERQVSYQCSRAFRHVNTGSNRSPLVFHLLQLLERPGWP